MKLTSVAVLVATIALPSTALAQGGGMSSGASPSGSPGTPGATQHAPGQQNKGAPSGSPGASGAAPGQMDKNNTTGSGASSPGASGSAPGQMNKNDSDGPSSRATGGRPLSR